MKLIKLKKALFLSIFFIYINTSSAQSFVHDFGVYAGYTSIQTDYGERFYTPSSISLASLSFTVAHSLHFYNLRKFIFKKSNLKNHLLLRTLASYESKRDLRHKGEWVSRNSIAAEQLRAMKGSVRGATLGMDLEIHFRDLAEFNSYSRARHRISPYISTGIRLFLYENDLSSDLGDWRTDNSLLFPKYRIDTNRAIGKGHAIGVAFTTGFRYNIARNLDLDSKISWILYNSDEIDGLIVDEEINKFNETTTSIQIGIVFRLGRNKRFKCF